MMGKYMYTTKIRLFSLLILCFVCSFIISTHSQAREQNIAIDIENDDFEFADMYPGDRGQIIPGDSGAISEADMRNGICGSVMHSDYEYVTLIHGWSFESSDPSILQIDSNGNYTVLGTGTVWLKIREEYYKGRYKDIRDYCAIPVTPGSLEVNEPLDSMYSGTKYESYSIRIYTDTSMAYPAKTEVTSYVFGQEQVIKMKNMPSFGVDESYHFEYKSSGSSVSCQYDDQAKCIRMSSYSKGKSTVTIELNNLVFNITFISKNVSLNKTSLLIATKEKKKIKLKGYDKKIKWRSTDPKVAKVNKKGEIVGKKKGNAIIYVQLDDYRLGCVVSVVTPGMKKVVNYAKWIPRHWKYSQANRMSKGYYDCSALVWKSYKKIGKNFGDKNYAPTAATMAQWCASNKKMIKGGITDKRVNKLQINPGDITFYTGSNNGRYKGIYHVEMIVGYEYGGWNGKKFNVYIVGARLGVGPGMELLARP